METSEKLQSQNPYILGEGKNYCFIRELTQRRELSEERFTEQIHQQEKEPENFGIFTIADTKEERKVGRCISDVGQKKKKF